MGQSIALETAMKGLLLTSPLARLECFTHLPRKLVDQGIGSLFLN